MGDYFREECVNTENIGKNLTSFKDRKLVRAKLTYMFQYNFNVSK